MVENMNKLEAAFLAGRLDAAAEKNCNGGPPEAAEELIRMILSESDCAALARLSKVLFHRPADLAKAVLPNLTRPPDS